MAQQRPSGRDTVTISASTRPSPPPPGPPTALFTSSPKVSPTWSADATAYTCP